MPQILHSLGILSYCPALDAHIRRGDLLPPQSSWEVQLRGCSIYATELLRREITRIDEDAKDVNAVLIDFLLYDLAKEKEVQAIEGECFSFSLVSPPNLKHGARYGTCVRCVAIHESQARIT